MKKKFNSAFLELSNNPDNVCEECLRKLERFLVVLYDRTSTKMRVNGTRKQLFSQKTKSIESIPPTQAALNQHTIEEQNTRVEIAGVNQLFQ